MERQQSKAVPPLQSLEQNDDARAQFPTALSSHAVHPSFEGSEHPVRSALIG
jgi:hypothetical protein